MVNYNMGQYYAWINLKKLVSSLLRKYDSTPVYRFKYIPPKNSNRANIVPFEEWKGSNSVSIQHGKDKNHLLISFL